MTQEELDSLLSELDNELPMNPAKQQQPSDDGYVDDFGRTSDLPMEGFAYNAVKDTGEKLGQWWEGAKSGYAEWQRAGESTNQVLTDTNATDEQKEQAVDYNKNAAVTFIDQTLKPVSYAAGVVNPIMALPALGADAANVVKEEVNKGNTYAPNVIGALGAKFSGAEAVVGAAKDPAAFATKAYQQPISTAMEVLPAAITGHLAYKGIKGIKAGEKPAAHLKPADLEALANELPDKAESIKDIEPPTAPIEAAPDIKGSDIIAAGEEQLGKPYELGADGTTSTDCGLFTQQTLAKTGIELDYRTADGQYRQLETEGKTFTNEAEAQPGDLVFFDVPSNRDRWAPSDDPAAVNSDGQAYKGVTHVGIYAGEGKVLQAGSRGVSYADINDFGDIVGFGKTGKGGKATGDYLSQAHAAAENGDYTAAYQYADRSGNKEWAETYRRMNEKQVEEGRVNADDAANHDISAEKQPWKFVESPEEVNQKTWYHGTAKEGLTPEMIDASVTNHEGLFGQGFYMTDNPDIAAGYSKARAGKTGTQTIYETKVDMGNVLNLEKPAKPEIAQVFRDNVPWDSYEGKRNTEITDAVNKAANKPGATTEEIWHAYSEALRDYSHSEGIPSSEFVENIGMISEGLKRLGYDALTHTGGKRTDKAPHQVLIALDPRDISNSGRTGQIKSLSRHETPGVEYSLSKRSAHEAMRSDMLNKAHEAAMNNDYETAYNLAKQSGDAGWEKAYKMLKDSSGGQTPPVPKLGGNVKGKYSGKNITKRELLDRVNEIFAPIRTGRIGQKGVEGFVNHGTGVIRTRNYGDLEVAAHEVGHLVDAALGLRKEAAFDAEFKKIVHERFGEGTYEPEQVRAEGIAEFTRDYVNNPETAKKNFPKYYAAFEEALSKNADIRARVNEFKDMVQAWNNQSPEARGRGAMSFAGDNKFETIKENAKNIAYKAYEAFFDDKVGLSKFTSEIEKQLGRKLEFEQNPYKKARMVQNSALARAEMLVTDGNADLVQATLNKLYNNKLKYAVTMKDIFNGLNPKTLNSKYPEYLKNGNFKNWHEAFSALLTVRRQRELQALEPDYRGPISIKDAQEIMQNAPKELQDLAQKFYQYNDNLLSIAEDGGLISKNTVATLRNKYKNYAPMARDFSDEAALIDAYGTGKSLGNISNPLKRLTEEGSTRSVVDPLESVLKNTYTLIDAVERNKVSQTFVDLSNEKDIGKFVEKVPGTTSDANKSIFTVMVDGKKQAYQTTPEFYRSIMSMNQASSNMLVSILKPFAQVLRVGATISPDFIVRNLIRDTLTAGIYSETGFKPVLDTLKGAKSLLVDKELAYEFKASGAPLSAFTGLDRTNINRTLDKMGGTGWKNAEPIKIIEGLYQGARKVSEAAESATRIREFERARQQGMSIEEAGLLAKDITLDFSRSGTITRQINQAIPFFNAVLQGGDRLVRAFKDNPLRTTQFLTTYIALPSIALWIINHEQDWYKELNDDIKNGSWLIKSGGTIIRIPKPFEPGILFGSSIERALDQAYSEDKEAVKQWAKYAIDGFRPSLMPAVAGPIIEWITNYNFFTERPVVGRKEQNLPDEMQYNAYTSELAKSLGKMTGTSPEKIDNTINGYTASAGKFVVGLMDNLIGDKKELPAKGISELPGIRGLTYTPFKNPKSVEEFYDKLEKLEKEHNAYGKKGNVPNNLRDMRKANEQIQDLNKNNRDITTGNKSPEEKRKLIDANSAKILELAKKSIGK